MNSRKIKVTLMNFHGIFSHLELLLEDTSTTPPTFYNINRWSPPLSGFNKFQYNGSVSQSSDAVMDDFFQPDSTFTFEIYADPTEIADKWNEVFLEKEANILTNNCADAVEWFLEKFAAIPKSSAFSMPISSNHLILGIVVPSFLPLGITMSGRVMDNAKYHIGIRDDVKAEGSSLGLKIAIAVAAIAIAVCITGIVAAAIFFTGGIMAGVIAGCVVASLLCAHGMFKAANKCAAQVAAVALHHPDGGSSSEAEEPVDGLAFAK